MVNQRIVFDSEHFGLGTKIFDFRNGRHVVTSHSYPGLSIRKEGN